MTIPECYTLLGGDYKEVLERMQDEKRVCRFAFKFLDDSNFEILCKALESGRYDEAISASHNIKGICANLGFGNLFRSSSALTDKLRCGCYNSVNGLYEQVKKDYFDAAEALKKCKEQLSE